MTKGLLGNVTLQYYCIEAKVFDSKWRRPALLNEPSENRMWFISLPREVFMPKLHNRWSGVRGQGSWGRLEHLTSAPSFHNKILLVSKKEGTLLEAETKSKHSFFSFGFSLFFLAIRGSEMTSDLQSLQ